jgi:hypothetical protein
MREELDAIFRTFQDAIMDWSGAWEPWRPMSRWTVSAWLTAKVAE